MGGESSKSEVSGGKTKSADPINAVFVANVCILVVLRFS